MEGLGGILAPLRAGDSIQAVWPQSVVLGNDRMLEVFVSVAKPDALHNSPGPRVQHGRERHDLSELEPLETDPQGRACLVTRSLAPLPARTVIWLRSKS